MQVLLAWHSYAVVILNDSSLFHWSNSAIFSLVHDLSLTWAIILPHFHRCHKSCSLQSDFVAALHCFNFKFWQATENCQMKVIWWATLGVNKLQPRNNSGPLSTFINKLLLTLSHEQPIEQTSIVHDCFQATMAELSSCDSDNMAPKPKIFTVWQFTGKTFQSLL